MHKRVFVPVLIFAVWPLASCAPRIRQGNDYSPQRAAITGAQKPVPQPLNAYTEQQNQVLASVAAPETHYGTGVFTNPPRHAKSVRAATSEGGTTTLNFDGQPVQTVVKAILGDVLHANYSISPKVKGTVTFVTSQPVTEVELLPILQMLLSWTGNALVQQNGDYLVVPVEQAAPGNLVPGLEAVSPGAGYAAQLFPLHYVSAEAMQKLLKPFADPKAFLLVDPTRNLLVMAGTPAELANYRRTIRTFDVDWLRGMSVAVIPIQHVQASDMLHQLTGLLSTQFGSNGESMSKLIRMIALRESNSLVVITSQPAYIGDIRKLAAMLEGAESDGFGLYVYNVINVKASDLAKDLSALLGNSIRSMKSGAGAVAPEYSPLEQSSARREGLQRGMGTFAPSPNTLAGMKPISSSGTGIVSNGGVRIAGISENNQLLVLATPDKWKTLLPVIKQLDEKPLQVQIETKVLEVTLTGEFQFGVKYYLAGLIGTQPGSPPTSNESFHRHQSAAGLGGVQYATSDALFYSFAGNNLQFAISAIESSGDAEVLSAPSTVVLNNQETTFKVGEKIPVVQTAIVPGLGTAATTNFANATSVNYIDTGVLLDVVPRVSPGGLVYMSIQQIVSAPTTRDQFGNYTITDRALSTEVAVQSGQTVLLGGLIQRTGTTQDNGVPFLNRIPAIGRSFGTADRKRDRTELIVLITPHVISDPADARHVTDDYEAEFRSIRPIRQVVTPKNRIRSDRRR